MTSLSLSNLKIWIRFLRWNINTEKEGKNGGGEVGRKNMFPLYYHDWKRLPPVSPLVWNACYTFGSQNKNLELLMQLGRAYSISVALFEYTVDLWPMTLSGVFPQTLPDSWVRHSTKWATWWIRSYSSALSSNRLQLGSGLRASSKQEARRFRPWSGEHSTPRMNLRALWQSSDFCPPKRTYHPNEPSLPHQKKGIDVKLCT